MVNIKIITSFLLIIILLATGCTQQQELTDFQKPPSDPQSALFVKDPVLTSNELFDVRYLYYPGDVNSERILIEVNNINNKYGNVVHVTKFDLSKGVPVELKRMGYVGESGSPSMIIGDKLIDPLTDADLDIFEATIKEYVENRG
jgi:hypothetical protein